MKFISKYMFLFCYNMNYNIICYYYFLFLSKFYATGIIGKYIIIYMIYSEYIYVWMIGRLLILYSHMHTH